MVTARHLSVRRSLGRATVHTLVCLTALASPSAGDPGGDLTVLEQPMTTSAKARYSATLGGMTVEQLGTRLRQETSPQRIRLILAELSTRGSEGAGALDEYRKTLTGARPAERMLLAETAIAAARARNGGSQYVKSLATMLCEDNDYLVDAAALELGRVGSADALSALKSHEKEGRPMIKIARLQSEYGKLSAEARTAAILESARAAIRGSGSDCAPALVAESSLLAWVGVAAKPVLRKELATLPPEPSDVFGQRYRAFLGRMLSDIQRAEAIRKTATMPVATMPATASSSAPSVSEHARDVKGVSTRQAAGEASGDGSQQTPRNPQADSASLHWPWLLIGGCVIIVIVLAVIIGNRVHVSRSRE